MRKYLWLGLFLIIALGVFLFPVLKAAVPYGATVTQVGNNVTSQADAADFHGAQAGNISQLSITAYSTTVHWAGYYGNISGTVQLADASDNILYNWSVADPQGEVYATYNSSVTWTNIQCFNLTANGTTSQSGAATQGAMNLNGMNLTMLHTLFNMSATDPDALNNTFDRDGSLPGNDGTHDLFYTNALQFSAGECYSANTFNFAAQGGSDGEFEEVLLYDPDGESAIFMAILEDNDDNSGFDNKFHDFQLMVLEDGEAGDQAPTTYYFFVEIE